MLPELIAFLAIFGKQETNFATPTPFSQIGFCCLHKQVVYPDLIVTNSKMLALLSFNHMSSANVFWYLSQRRATNAQTRLSLGCTHAQRIDEEEDLDPILVKHEVG